MSIKHGLLSLAILATIGGGTVSAAGVATPAKRALGQLHAHQGAARISPRDGFHMRDVVVDADGGEHVRFDRTYAGLPVIGGDVVVHSRNGFYRDMSIGQLRAIDVSTTPTIDGNEAVVVAGTRFGSVFSGRPERVLVVYARGKHAAQLAWRVRLHNAGADMTCVVSARDGAILDAWSNLETATATGTAHTLYSGDVVLTTNSIVRGGYELRDPSRGASFTLDASNSRTSGQVYKDADNIWGNYTNSDAATVAADAQYGMAMTWDFYLSAFGRQGIANNGKGAYSRVHYGRSYSNAYWSDGCFCMTYGDGDVSVIGPLVSLDIAGHEMSHGVNARTAGLIYSGESGGLNEANSDILGTMVEFFANNAKDTPDYMIGEKIIKANVNGSANQAALRRMYNPMLDGASPNCWYSGIGDLDVHYSSGVANHFFYLLAEGSAKKTFSGVDHTSPTCNGASVTGIGRSKARQVWYRALTVYFTSTTDYAGARVATIAAAKDLYGTNSTQAKAVAAAWSAVSVN
ncbi:MAG: M4 family metallopeptidase [Thermomonas sp.]